MIGSRAFCSLPSHLSFLGLFSFGVNSSHCLPLLLFTGCGLSNSEVTSELSTRVTTKGARYFILAKSKISVKPGFFKILTDEQVDAAHAALSAPPLPYSASQTPQVREFNLDIAKLLLQFASIVYERKSEAIYKTIDHSKKEAKKSSGFSIFPFGGPNILSPAFTNALSGEEFRGHILKRLEKKGLNPDGWGTQVIAEFSEHVEVGYAPVSELNSSESVGCFFFLHPTVGHSLN